ncbi:MAG: hypothetical protein ACRC0G_15985 [Fusobacteriaceae bacterium]
MAKKRIKVFASGKYPQGEFSDERVKEIFSGIEGTVKGIFSHSSKWITENKDPVEVGEFSNFTIDKGNVFADIEFNVNGAKYHDDGILKGVSVEIDTNNNTLSRIAVLPVGIKPAVTGAEFNEEEEGITIEFEEVREVTITEIIIALANINVAEVPSSDLEVLNNQAYKLQDEKWKINKLIESGYTVQKEFSKEEIETLAKPLGFVLAEFQEPVKKTVEEIRAEIKAEIEFETKIEALVNDSKTKIPPVLQGIVEFAIKKAGEERETIIEFSENEKISMFEKLELDIKSLKKHPTQETYYKDLEFGEEKEIDYMAKSKAETEKLYGGR